MHYQPFTYANFHSIELLLVDSTHCSHVALILTSPLHYHPLFSVSINFLKAIATRVHFKRVVCMDRGYIIFPKGMFLKENFRITNDMDKVARTSTYTTILTLVRMPNSTTNPTQSNPNHLSRPSCFCNQILM